MNHLELYPNKEKWTILGGYANEKPEDKIVITDSQVMTEYEHAIYNQLNGYEIGDDDILINVDVWEDVDLINSNGEEHGVIVVSFDVSFMDVEFNVDGFYKDMDNLANNKTGPMMIKLISFEHDVYTFHVQAVDMLMR